MLTVRLLTLCADRLRDTDAAVLGTSMRVHVGPPCAYLYPDVVIVRGWPDFLDDHQDTIANPYAVIEVASSAAARDQRGARLLRYQACATLEHYLLVMEDAVLIEHHHRSERGWEMCQHARGDTLLMADADVELAVDAIYAWR